MIYVQRGRIWAGVDELWQLFDNELAPGSVPSSMRGVGRKKRNMMMIVTSVVKGSDCDDDCAYDDLLYHQADQSFIFVKVCFMATSNDKKRIS